MFFIKLQILIPQYEETDEIIKPLLDSISIQQNVDLKNEVGVIIVNDGSDTFLSDELLNSYPFKIDYYKEEHRGVSGTRNACLDHATADYIMFCDADDMFYSVCGLYLIFREIVNGGFDSLVSLFVEEARTMDRKTIVYINHELDSTFVHGKVHRRQYLLNEKIRWNENLTIHEDSYFNILCQKLSTNVKYCSVPFYLWRWRANSVCRHDEKYILRTFTNMLDSSDACVQEFIKRNKITIAKQLVTGMIFECYYTMNKKEWLNQVNQKYRKQTEKRFKEYYLKYKEYFETVSEQDKNQIIITIKNRMFQEGLIMESMTFADWIQEILKL